MEKIIASRLSDGNKIFPPEIHLDEQSLTVKMPGLFNGKSQNFNYRDISSVSIETPLVGYSTITFYAAGTKISAHGFSKAEVKKIKAIIEERKTATPASSESSYSPFKSTDSGQRQRRLGLHGLIHGEEREKSEEEKIREEERHERHRKEMKNDIKNGATAAFKGVGNILNSKKIKEALDLHTRLMSVTDDIDISLARGEKEQAIELIKKLNHPSSLRLNDDSDTYIDFWMKKRKEYISKIS